MVEKIPRSDGQTDLEGSPLMVVKKTTRIGFNWDLYYKEREKLRDPDGVHCIICGKKLPPRRRSYCSDRCYSNWWKNLPPSIGWGVFRNTIIKRDEWMCVSCGGNAIPPEVHHILPLKHGGDQFDEMNCVTLCYGCHKVSGRKIHDTEEYRQALRELLEKRLREKI